ncbi:DUF6879 family protein [Actinopolymorpha sp. B9G3]|uniref:DUF6879 family protein n=1 Tax=Actinopolymorpha sp. B9G3 TaxID=3158970 RepID=UPI0032D94CA7
MRRPISLQEFVEQLATFEHTAFRLELQSEYREPSEAESLALFLAGDPIDPGTDPNFVPWFEQISRLVSDGKRVERVRVQEEPPTPYQRWERWLGAWNIRAGEQLRYMTRSRAYEIGLLPATGTTDWWLLDSNRLLLMPFDQDGNRLGDELVTDPEVVVQACAWRDLAVHYSILEPLQDAAA